jgi:hypothetical protein
MTKLYLNYDPFLKNIIYENHNLLINRNISYFSNVENQNIIINIINIINIFLLILFFHYTKFLKIIIEIFTL